MFVLVYESYDTFKDAERRERNVVLMTRFGIAIMLRLQELNQDAFYEYKLRIGKDNTRLIYLIFIVRQIEVVFKCYVHDYRTFILRSHMNK